jgi:hypothetical protein
MTFISAKYQILVMDLIQTILPEKMKIEAIKLGELGPTAYAVQRAEELATYMAYAEKYSLFIDTSCWVADPTTYSTVMSTQC